MRKLILLLVLVMALGTVGAVLALVPDQTVNVDVTPTINISITPNPLTFGTVDPGTSKELTPAITFNTASSSAMNISITVSNVTPGLFHDHLAVRNSTSGYTSITGFTGWIDCIVSAGVCTYTNLDWDANLTIPSGTPAGITTGTITYTVSAGP